MLIGVIATSSKENEKRFPLHYLHINALSEVEKSHLIFEENYPGWDKVENADKLQTAPREEIFARADLLIVAKPTKKDFPYFHEGQIIWGWPHCIQGKGITDIGINKHLTFIAWEAMYKWNDGVRGRHIFSRNNELAGFASVVHALTSLGMTAGIYGKNLKAAVIGYGSTGKGAINALRGLGASDITVYTRRSRFEINDALPGIKFAKYKGNNGKVTIEGKPAATSLCEYDIVVNCILQNPLKPLQFMSDADAQACQHPLLIIDVSSDEKMGFEFARPTGFTHPSFKVGSVTYFAVNHSPSFFYESASYEISGALLPYLHYILEHGTYKGNETLQRAVEIENGQVLNPAILIYQHREKDYPYKILTK